MEIVVQKIERQEIHLVFVQDAEENIDDVSPLVTSLAKLKKIINKPGFKNEFGKGERELWNGIFNEILSEEPVQGIQHGGGDRVYIQD